jgi:hypothetical protein
MADFLSLGFLSTVVPQSLVEKVLSLTLSSSKRNRRLPAPAVVYFVMLMSMFRDSSLEELMRIFAEASLYLDFPWKGMPTPTKSAISQARTRLGSEPMRLIADEVLRPIAPRDLPGAWYKGMRLMSLAGACFGAPDEAENREYLGPRSASEGEAACPQARVLALVETRTRAVAAAEMGPYAVSQGSLACALIERGKLTPEMLLFADMSFFGYGLWSKAAAAGAKLVFRAKADLTLPILDILPDGSFISVIPDSRDENSELMLRVIDYKINNLKAPIERARPGEGRHRLATSLFDHELAPSNDLAALCHERWEIEALDGEFKKALQGGKAAALRSKTPELVFQELWGLILVHFALRRLMAQSAQERKIAPDRSSFKKAVSVIGPKSPLAKSFSP